MEDTLSPPHGAIHPHTPSTFKPLLEKLIENPREFTHENTRDAFHHLARKDFEGATPVQVGAFLMALKYSNKAHSPDVIVAAAGVMREYAIHPQLEGVMDDFLVDIVGTGGDGYNTFNVSTTAAIVAAGAGARVCKHGSKASTSSSGSSDLLGSLGCVRPPPPTGRKIPNVPFIFLAASDYHPSIGQLSPVRKSLPFRTIFNVLGPLLNPTNPKGMVLGVYTRELGPVFATALKQAGLKRALVVCGQEGLDEISIAGGTWAWSLGEDGVITESVLHPTHFGLPAHPLDTVTGSTPAVNAAILTALLTNSELAPGTQLPPKTAIENIKDFVLLNAAALLVIAGVASDWKDGVRLAKESVESGKAWNALVRFRDLA